MELANLDPKYRKATLSKPLPYGYLYAGMKIDPPGRVPFVRRSARREEALGECKAVAGRLEALGEVVRATVYRAVLIPPVGGAPRFDAVALVKTTSPETVAGVRSSEPFGRLGADFVMAARNARRIGDTQKTLSGTFLFNHFTAEDPEAAVEAWENLTGWYTAKTGVDNSTLLRPLGEAPYAFVNYVRLPRGPVRFMLDQLLRRLRQPVAGASRAGSLWLSEDLQEPRRGFSPGGTGPVLHMAVWCERAAQRCTRPLP